MKVTIQDSRTSVTVEPRDFRVTVSGARGPQGAAGIGIAAGGTEGQILAKASATDYDTEWIDNFAPNVEVYVKNSSGSPMTKGQIVYISGADGTNPTVSLAIATSEMGSSKTIGWLKQDLANGDLGYVITEGLLEGINTNGASAAGDPVWLSPTTAGGVVYGLASKPSAPNHLVFLGYVLRKQTNNGKVYVKVQNGFELGELHDVYNGAKTTPVAADALLLRDSADSNLWKRLTWTNALAGVKSHMDTFKSVAGGYASLDGSGKVPSSELPSYVDDVVEVANYAALPGTGETGKIYVTLDNNKCYRWSGSVYVEISPSIAPAWGAITGTLSNQTDLQTALDGKVDENAAITGATKTKITYDAKGLVTAGADAAIADITGLQTALDGKQSTLSLTTTGTSGAATLVGSTLNIPQYQGVLTNPVTGTGTAGQVAYFNGTSAVTGSSNLFWDSVNNRLGVGVSTSLTARAHVRGSGTTSATTALLVQNSTPSALLTVTDDGQTILSPTANTSALASSSYSVTGSGTTPLINLSGTWNTTGIINGILINITDTASANSSNLMNLQINSSSIFRVAKSIGGFSGGPIAPNGYGLGNGAQAIFNCNASNSVISSSGTAINFSDSTTDSGYSYHFYSQQYVSKNYTSGIGGLVTILRGFAPTSGTGVFNALNIQPTINQTGGANGITRGLYVNPTLTSAADWRSIETSNSTGYAAYFAGSADLFLGNGTDVQIGTTTGTKIGTATTQKIGLWNATPIVQPTTAVASATRVGGAGNTVTDTDTFDGYTIAQLVKALRNMGALA